jgi:hypothetical protein
MGIPRPGGDYVALGNKGWTYASRRTLQKDVALALISWLSDSSRSD